MVYRQTPRSEAVRAASREKILQAALKLFMEKGYDATTMQDIVAEAGTSIGNAYFYFGSKDQLVNEVVVARMYEVLAQTERLTASIPAGPARLGAMIVARVDSMLGANRDFSRLLIDTDQRWGTIQLVEDVTIERWLPLLAECLPDRDPAELPAIATAIWGVNRAFVSRAVRGKLDVDRATALQFLVRWSLRALSVPESDIESILRDSMSFSSPA